MILFEKLFGNPVIEKVLFFILVNEEGYGYEMSQIFGVPVYSVQKALQRLELGGVLAAQLKGKTRIYRFNPRYPFLEEIKALLTKAYSFLPKEQKQSFYERPVRKRPRRKGKPL